MVIATGSNTSVYESAYLGGQSALVTEIGNLHDHNKALIRELTELKKERLMWRDTQRHAAELDDYAARIKDESLFFQSECGKLRRLNIEVERKLERELAESMEARQRWAEKEDELIKTAKSERAKLRELKQLLAVKQISGYELEDSASTHSEESGHFLEIVKLKKTISEITEINMRQEAEIVELNRVIVILMNQIDPHYGQGGVGINVSDSPLVESSGNRVNSVGEEDDDSSGANNSFLDLTISSQSRPEALDGITFNYDDVIQNMDLDTLTQSAIRHFVEAAPDVSVIVADTDCVLSQSLFASEGMENDDTLVFESAYDKIGVTLSGELEHLNEIVPMGSSETSALNAKLRSYGLSTEGGRAAKKKRLDRYKQQRKGRLAR